MSIIERVAKDIFYQSRSMKGWDDSSESYRNKFRTMARAAIEAMRVPTKAMILAGVHHDNMGDMEGRWMAMIDAALSQDTHSLPSSPGASKPAVETPQAPAAGTNSGDAP
jgi:hypothetical protein